MRTPFGTLAALQEGHRGRAAARAAGGAAVGPFRHAAARHRAHACCPSTTSTSPTGTMRATSPRAAGRFGFDDYVEHLIQFLEAIGPGAHVVAVCQPCVAVLAAVAVMAQSQQSGAAAQHDADGRPDRHAGQPDQGQRARQSKPIDWFEKNLIATVPCRYRRRGPPGLSGLRAARRLHAHEHRAPRQGASSSSTRTFGQGRTRQGAGRPRLSTTSISRCSTSRAEFYLETVQLGVPGARAAARATLDMARRDGRSARHPAHRAAHGRGRARRHLRGRPDARRARSLLEPAALPQAPPHAGRRRPLRRVQRQALGAADLPAGEERHFVERVGPQGDHFCFCEPFLHREPGRVFPMFELNSQNLEVEDAVAEPVAARDERAARRLFRRRDRGRRPGRAGGGARRARRSKTAAAANLGRDGLRRRDLARRPRADQQPRGRRRARVAPDRHRGPHHGRRG